MLGPFKTLPQQSSSFHSSVGNPSVLDEGGRASQVPRAIIELVGYGSVIWPDSLSEWLIEGAGLQQMFCCLTASTARALLCMAIAEFRIQVMVEAVVACSEPEHCYLFPFGTQGSRSLSELQNGGPGTPG